MAEDVVTVTSGNTYVEGFCIHSNTFVELTNGNTFESGVIVSMPDKDDLVMPDGGLTSNPGLSEALRDGSIALRVTSRIDDIEAGLQDPSSPLYRSYITSNILEDIPRTTLFDIDQWQSGRIHTINCSGPGQKVQITQKVQRKHHKFAKAQKVPNHDDPRVHHPNSQQIPQSLQKSSAIQKNPTQKCGKKW